jgi:hypothetical protein
LAQCGVFPERGQHFLVARYVGALDLLRSGARGNGQKLHELASEVVGSFATPDPILRELARHPEFMTMPREQRIVQTEEFYRQINDLMARNGRRNGKAYMWERANPYCNETMDVAHGDITSCTRCPATT